jgi:hypothetical protein
MAFIIVAIHGLLRHELFVCGNENGPVFCNICKQGVCVVEDDPIL